MEDFILYNLTFLLVIPFFYAFKFLKHNTYCCNILNNNILNEVTLKR